MVPLAMRGPSINQAEPLKPNYAFEVELGPGRAVTTSSLLIRGRSRCTASTSVPRRLGVARVPTSTLANPASAKNRRISDAVYSRTCPMWPTVRSLPYSQNRVECESTAECKADNIAESVQVWSREIE